MWNNAANHPDPDAARRLSIELALASQTAAPITARPVGFSPPVDPSFAYDSAQVAMQPVHGHHPGAAAASASADNSDQPLGYQAPPTGTSAESSDGPKEEPSITQHTSTPARGKPEAVAAQLSSSSRVQEKMKELKHEVEAKEDAAAVAKGVEEETAEVVAVAADEDEDMEGEKVEKAVVVEEKSPAAPKKRKRSPAPKKSTKSQKNVPTMNDPVQPITAAEYENLKSLMIQFCRVPLLAEFSRPVSLLHPEVRK